MKKILYLSILISTSIFLTACGNENKNDIQNENINENEIVDTQNTPEETPIQNEEIKSTENDEILDSYDDEYIIDDEIIEFDDSDNEPIKEEILEVDEIVNCNGCVFSYFSEAKSIGSTLLPEEYTTDINTLKTSGWKQRHNFFGFVLSDNKISRAYSCIRKSNKIYCLEGSTNWAYHQNNISILNQIFTADQCKYISDGHTYWCTDGDYNGDTKTSGYTSLHYETSCTIYGSDARKGELICH